MDTFGYKNPWIDEEDLKQSGAIIIDRRSDRLEKETRLACPYLDDDYEIIPVEYKFFVHNALGGAREYTTYYVIIPPME